MIHGWQERQVVVQEEVTERRELGLCLCVFQPLASVRRLFLCVSRSFLCLRLPALDFEASVCHRLLLFRRLFLIRFQVRVQIVRPMSRLALVFPQVAVVHELCQALAAPVTRFLQMDTRVVVLIQGPVVEPLVTRATDVNPLLHSVSRCPALAAGPRFSLPLLRLIGSTSSSTRRSSITSRGPILPVTWSALMSLQLDLELEARATRCAPERRSVLMVTADVAAQIVPRAVILTASTLRAGEVRHENTPI